MSTQTTIVCDRCKDEITPGQQRETTLYTKRVIDLCPECQRLFTLFLQGSALTTSPEDWARDAAKQFEDFQPDPEAKVPERTAKVVDGLKTWLIRDHPYFSWNDTGRCTYRPDNTTNYECGADKESHALVSGEPSEPEDPRDLDETCPMHGTKRGRIVVSSDYIPEPGCTCRILYPDTCVECYGEAGRHKMDCTVMRQSPSALDSITTAQWRAVQDRYEPIVNEVNEARRMRVRLLALNEKADARPGAAKGIVTSAQVRHAISGDLEVPRGTPE